ncbi:hypothetical protein DEU56DRAFT_784726 [Suillus clintonianus]|uniref:uncharacterized protein n=1 Tax=Suillus clintonianus TaxID=1904413 RepID=UPI001B874426|nr:uncharacterized protein DEU56DRAFT_784726 [Suillus clintonianus]KAG2147577.1 hypothetical protein DEU56DRAFT_784726 [Suillus clintonianus]
MDPIQPKHSPAHTHEPTDNSTLSEVESLSDSEWLDVASGRESDSDSIYSSRGTDQERTSSRSRSRRSSFSYGSSRDGDVDAWEGLIEDSADEGLVPDAVRLSSSPVAFSRGHFTSPTDEDVGDATEEQRVKEGLDQSMISTLSSSRSSSVHASTVITSPRDLRLSFPDPITSSREELSSSSFEDILSPSPGATFSGPDPDVTVHITDLGGPNMPGSSSAPISIDDAMSTLLDSDMNVSLYGLPYPHKWSFVSTLLEKVVRGARLTIATPLEEMDGPVRQLHIEGRTDRSLFYPRIITIIDRTQGDREDPLADFSTGHPSLAIVFLPFSPLQLPEHAAYLPVLVPAPCAIDSLQSEDAIRNSAQEAWDLFNVPSDRVLRLSDPAPCVVNADVIESLPPYRAYRAFDRIFSRGRKKSVKFMTNSPHTLTIFTMVSLVLGVVVGSTFRGTAPVVTPTPVTTAVASAASTPFLWAFLHPVINHSHESIPAKTESTAISLHSSLKDFALSVFNPDPTSVSISKETSTSVFRSASSFSEKLKFSKDVILRPTSSLMSLEGSTKSLSVVPSMTASQPHVEEAVPTPSSSALASSTLGLSFLQDYLPKFVDIHGPAVLAAVNADMQDIIDALDSLVQAISRQAHVVIAQTNALIQYSTTKLEQRAPELEAVMDALNARNEHAQRRAKELKDNGAKWLHETGEALMNRASRARGKAKEITEDIEQIWAESKEKWDVCKMRGAQKCSGRRGCKKAKNCRGARSKKCTGGWLRHAQYY